MKKKELWSLSVPCPETGCQDNECGTIMRKEAVWCPTCMQQIRLEKALKQFVGEERMAIADQTDSQ